MNEQKQTAKLIAVMAENLPEMTVEQRQRWIGDPKGLQNFLAGLVSEVTKALSFLISTQKQVVNYDRSIKDSLKAGHFDWTNSGITDVNFPFPSDKQGKREVEFGLFHFKKVTQSDDNIAKMKAEGFRPATIKELLAFGEENPEVQREFPVVALGSVVKLNANSCQCVGVLDWSNSERDAGLDFYGNNWFDRCRFLAVRLSAQAGI